MRVGFAVRVVFCVCCLNCILALFGRFDCMLMVLLRGIYVLIVMVWWFGFCCLYCIVLYLYVGVAWWWDFAGVFGLGWGIVCFSYVNSVVCR